MNKNWEENGWINEMQLTLPALPVNEGMARAAVGAFCAQLGPSATEIADIKCAVSEAVTNCIVHAYREGSGMMEIRVRQYPSDTVRIDVRDRGCGIPDVTRARQPLFTTDAAGERSGMGFTVMENFTDHMAVESQVGIGTAVSMQKHFRGGDDVDEENEGADHAEEEGENFLHL